MFFGKRFLIAKIRVNIYTLKLIFSLSSSARQNERLTKRECSVQTLFGVLTKTYDVLEQGQEASIFPEVCIIIRIPPTPNPQVPNPFQVTWLKARLYCEPNVFIVYEMTTKL